MLLKVLTYPDPRLRQKAQPVPKVTPELQKLADDMLETMYHENGIGLAATQVGEAVRLLVMDTRPLNEEGEVDLSKLTELEREVAQPLVIFNPVITKAEGKTQYEEGCLSVPSFYELVDRYQSIELNYQDRNGQPQSIQLDGLMSICVQHEMDHLEGKLFIDRLSFVKSSRIKKRIEKHGYPTPEEAKAVREEKRERKELSKAKREEAL